MLKLPTKPTAEDPIRVLIVDDSSVVRTRLTRELSVYPAIRVVGSAPDPFVARDMIGKLDPEVLILDLEMPRMDGLTFLRKIMKFRPTPTVVVSSLTPKGAEMATACLQAGAIEVLCKPSEAYSIGDLSRELAGVLMGARYVNLERLQKRSAEAPAVIESTAMLQTTNKIIAIGSSTGGTDALTRVLTPLPARMHGIVMTQHMPEHFTATFAGRLNELCKIEVREAQDGDTVARGLALLAPGGKQMKLVRSGAVYKVRVAPGPPVCRHAPSVEVLMESVARTAGANAMGVMLTGMGNDGAGGMRSMHEAGAFNVAQDEKSCVVFGMPKEAIAAGGVDEIISLDRIPRRIVDYAEGKTKGKGKLAG
jgi:two-component system chemotaxis response regulator CheB